MSFEYDDENHTVTQTERNGVPIRLLKPEGDVLESYAYDEFGCDVGYTPSQFHSFGYTGYQKDSVTGIYYAQAREYMPVIARFAARDFVKGQQDDPLSMNEYIYCRDNPTEYADANGLFVLSTLAIIGVGAAVGALTSAGVNAVSQGIKIAKGEQEEFQWGSLAGSAVEGAVVGGVAAIPGLGTVAAAALTVTAGGVGAAANSAISQGIDEGKVDGIIAVIPEKEASRIQGLEDAILMTGYFSIIVIGLLIFFVRRRKYTSWYIPFYWRMEKFCSENQIYQMYPGYNTEEAFIAYGNEHADTFSRQFAATQLTEMEKKKKKREIVIGVVSALAIMAAIILVICLGTTIQSIADNRKNDDRTVKVLEELQTAIDGGEEPLGEESERYNFANIVSRARESFPDEDVYYKLVTTDDYVALIITTKKKTNVYIDRYTPVEGAVGDLNTIYKLEISMVSNVIQPYDVLNNYTGILYK